MEIKNNFLSVISLGSFNPAILTPEFLVEQKIFSFESPPVGTTSPVISQIKSGNISLLVELERFQVMHDAVDDFQKSPIVSISSNYLDVLKYTPIFVQGINFNLNLKNYGDSVSLKKIFDNPIKTMVEYLHKFEEYLIDVKTKVLKGRNETEAINCKYFIDAGISVAVNLKKEDKEVVLNFNYEVQNIKDDRSRLKNISDNYQRIWKLLESFVEKIKK
jgi:hypothetical protein